MPSSAVHVDGWYSIHIDKDIKSFISNIRILKEIKEGQVTDLCLFVVAEMKNKSGASRIFDFRLC